MKYQGAYISFVVSNKSETLARPAEDERPLLPREVARGVEQAGGLEHLLRSIPKARELEEDARYHHALSDTMRQRILWALSMSDLCPCVIKQITKVSDSKLSYHLRVLEDAGLIKSRRTRNWRVYSITASGESALEVH